MRALVLCLAGAWAAFAQIGSDGLTVTASRPRNVTPDQVTLGIYLTSPVTGSLDDVLAALQSAKVAATDLSSLGTYSPDGRMLQWVFTRTVAFTDLNTTLNALSAAQQNLAKQKASMDLSFYISGTSLSPQLEASQPCPFGALIADAQTQAQKLAGAAGVTLGPIMAMAEGGGTQLAVPTLATRSGDFSILGGVGAIFDPIDGTLGLGSLLVGVLSAPLLPPPSCTLAVQFKLGR